jgi:hypothetical protein
MKQQGIATKTNTAGRKHVIKFGTLSALRHILHYWLQDEAVQEIKIEFKEVML